MWDLPGSGIKPVPPALAGGFLSTEPPGESRKAWLLTWHMLQPPVDSLCPPARPTRGLKARPGGSTMQSHWEVGFGVQRAWWVRSRARLGWCSHRGRLACAYLGQKVHHWQALAVHSCKQKGKCAPHSPFSSDPLHA